jgi:ABC-2 type transport system permease protein
MRPPTEHQQAGIGGLLRACLATARLEYRNLRYYPVNLLLTAAQELTVVGVWYFVGRFLSARAGGAVSDYGGNYLAYVVVGVLLNQIGMTALNSPFTTVSEAFWDKRLETYRLAVHGIWANILGRLAWQVGFSTVLQGVAYAGLLAAGGVQVAGQVAWGLVALAFGLLLIANAGLGIAGASLFFLLEVKSGQDPITWAYRYLVQLASGLYIPVALLPGWLHGVGAVLPQTYGLAAARALVLTGAGLENPLVQTGLGGLVVAAGLCAGLGGGLFTWALRRAERQGGIGVVV